MVKLAGFSRLGWALLALCVMAPARNAFAQAGDENDYYKLLTLVAQSSPTGSREKVWRPGPDGVALEVSGLTSLPDGRLAVAIRKGDVYLLDNVYDDPPKNLTYHRFASALHEPLGLLYRDGTIIAAQRSELTQLRDVNGDDAADEYLCLGKGWGVSGNYHEYAYGPVLDPNGDLWVTLNIGMGKEVTRQQRWRGWCVKINPEGELQPVCLGLRSPCGVGANLQGDMFATDQQGNWIATCSLVHLRRGAFFGNPESMTPASPAPFPLPNRNQVRSGLPWPEALRQIPHLQPPAVWFPYKKAGQSATDVLCDTTQGKFGPFAGQLFVGEFRLASLMRVFLEQVDGQYQGACFPFRDGFASAVLRMTWGQDGGMFVGLSNRGWSSIGTASYGLQRLVWTGKTPFEVKEMRAKPDGFELLLTRPADSATASDISSYSLTSYTYLLQQAYGSPEIDQRTLPVRKATLSEDGMRIRLTVDGLREGYVHELHCLGLRDATGAALLHDAAYYTLNRIPR